jgi:hypothetical protein
MARSVDADRDYLPGDLSSLYELMRRSTSAECGLAAKSRASAKLNAFHYCFVCLILKEKSGNSLRSMTGFITVNLKFITVHIARTVKLFPALLHVGF